FDIEVCPKAERIHGHAHEGLQSPDAGKVYNRDVLACRGVWPPFGVRKGVPRRFHHVGFFADGIAHEHGKEIGQLLLSFGVRDPRTKDRPAVSSDGEVAIVHRIENGVGPALHRASASRTASWASTRDSPDRT